MPDPIDFVAGSNGFADDASELPFRLPLELNVEDPDTIAELCQFGEGDERERFALNALRIGVLALRQARGQIDGEQIRRESERLLLALENQLKTHAGGVHDRLTSALKEYFDPDSGRFQERVNRLISKDGELEAMLRRQIGGDGSELSRTLAAHLGPESPLLKILSPTESAGLMKALRDTLDDQLRHQRERILEEFSLNNKDSALSRLVGELSTNQGKLTDSLQEKIDDVVKEFSLDEDNSALSRLVRNVEGAQKTITSEFSLDNDTSALSRLKKLLECTQQAIDSNLTLDNDDSSLSRLRKEVLEILEKHSQTNQMFQNDVKLTLEKMVVQRAEAARSTRHGLIFEDRVCEFLSDESRKLGDIATRTGETTGQIKGRKFGDCVIELGPDSAAPGARIVVEAKDKDDYSLARAREEIQNARANREAQIGVFIYSIHNAPPELSSIPLLRMGDDIFVAWDPEILDSDIYLRTAITLARALCIRGTRQSEAQLADFRAIEGAILDIQKCAENLAEIEKSANTIHSGAEKILKRVDIDRRSLNKQISILNEKTAELRQLIGGQPAAGT